MAPSDVNTENSEDVWWKIYGDPPELKKQPFQTGDYVRIVMRRRQFQKEADINWSKEIFQIATKLSTTPITYSLQDLNGEGIKGSFYTEELQKVKLPVNQEYRVETILKSRKRGKVREFYVKWEGYPNSFNSWIRSTDFKRPKKNEKR